MERWKTELLPLLPAMVRDILSEIREEDRLLEIRLRAEQPMQLVFERHDRLVYGAGGKPLLHRAECAELLSALCDHSVYAWEQELANGFFTASGGYRVGIAGRAIRDANGTVRYTEVNGFCIRIVREVPGAAEKLVPYLQESGRFLSTLLISPPNCGKTTVLRDLIRILSDGLCGMQPCRVCAADERFELSGASDGTISFDLGKRTDVVAGLRKAEALERMLTALSPQVLATDELVCGGGSECAALRTEPRRIGSRYSACGRSLYALEKKIHAKNAGIRRV